MTDLSALPRADQDAIADTLMTYLRGFKDRNPEAMATVYVHDADWRNVSGTVRQGVGDIVDYFRGLFSNEKFNQRELAGPPNATFRVVTPEVVVVSSRVIYRDQGADGAGRLDDNICAQQVLRRQGDGSWRIVSELVNDVGTNSTSPARSGS